MNKTTADNRNFIDRRTGETLFHMQCVHEDTALFSIRHYKPGNLGPFKSWIHETLCTTPPRIRPYYLVIDMTRMEPLSILSYEDCYALTYRSSEDRNLLRRATVFVMPPAEQSYFLYKALMARDAVSISSVHRASSVEEAMEWIALCKIGNR